MGEQGVTMTTTSSRFSAAMYVLCLFNHDPHFTRVRASVVMSLDNWTGTRSWSKKRPQWSMKVSQKLAVIMTTVGSHCAQQEQCLSRMRSQALNSQVKTLCSAKKQGSRAVWPPTHLHFPFTFPGQNLLARSVARHSRRHLWAAPAPAHRRCLVRRPRESHRWTGAWPTSSC